MIGRRMLLGALSAFAAARAAAATPLVVGTSTPLQSPLIDLLNAEAGGHFAAAGLAVEPFFAGNSSAVFQQLAGGRAQVVRAQCIDLFRVAAESDVPLLSVGCIVQRLNVEVVSLRAKPVTSPEGLRGKTVGVRAIRSQDEFTLDLLARQQGFPADDISRVLAPQYLAVIPLLTQARIDAALVSDVVAIAIRGTGLDIVSFPIFQFLPIPGQSYIVRQDFAERQPEVLRAFLRAIHASAREVIAHPGFAILARAASRFPDLTLQEPRVEEDIETTTIANWTSRGAANLLRHNSEAWEATGRLLAQSGMTRLPDTGALYTDRFLPEI